ncbi:MAG: hypothetical protein FWF99_05570, partial [Desulfovibrionaceae bacterium]|nr:hypothetical protein [Desulfovibrionaceae bacterium]
MTIDLASITQHVGSFPPDRAGDKQVFIRQDSVSGSSGLNILQRLFSSSGKQAENRATLEAFRESIAANPAYRVLLETSDVAGFFRAKYAEGTPLTAREVRWMQGTLDM